MNTIRPSRLLTFALLVDAAVSGGTGVLQLIAPAALATLLALPEALLTGTGEFFVVYALLLLVMASRTRLWAGLVLCIVLGNAAWALASVVVLATGTLAPNAIGVAFVLLQAAAVLLFAALQWRGLRMSLPADAPTRAVMS
jgi:hypothetical protein